MDLHLHYGDQVYIYREYSIMYGHRGHIHGHIHGAGTTSRDMVSGSVTECVAY